MKLKYWDGEKFEDKFPEGVQLDGVWKGMHLGKVTLLSRIMQVLVIHIAQ